VHGVRHGPGAVSTLLEFGLLGLTVPALAAAVFLVRRGRAPLVPQPAWPPPAFPGL